MSIINTLTYYSSMLFTIIEALTVIVEAIFFFVTDDTHHTSVIFMTTKGFILWPWMKSTGA
jgi:hypothetical protein